MSRISIKAAASGRYNHQYNPLTATTLDLGDLAVTRCIESVDSDSWKSVHGSGILRLAPQVFPPYGKMFVRSAAFFVPEYQLLESSQALHTNMASYKGQAVVTPGFYADTINDFFAQSSYSTVVGSAQTAANIVNVSLDTFDFIQLINNGGSASYQPRKLTTLGRKYFKIFKSLGYDFASYGNNATYATAKSSANSFRNAFALLAYCKIYVDYFLNGAFYNYSSLVTLLHRIQHNESYINSSTQQEYDSSTGLLTIYAFEDICNSILIPHESSLYTDAWNSPNSPDGTSPSVASSEPSNLMSPWFNQGSSYKETPLTSANVNSLRLGSNSNPYYVSTNGLKLLQSFDRFVRRWHLSGSKAVQRVYSMFGVKPEAFNSNYAHKLFETSERLNFYPVMSNSDTVSGSNGKRLGAYAGMGLCSLNYDFNYNANEYGYVICLSWIQMVPILMRGTDPMNLRKNSFDFYTPEYDGKAYRAIPQLEIGIDKRSHNNTANGDAAVYGFCNLYDDYRNMRDIVAGDFIVGGAKDFVFARDMSVLRDTGLVKPQTNLVHYYDTGDNVDLTNPFQLTASNGDRFYLFMEFDIDSDRPIKSDAEAYDLGGSGDTSIAINGNEMN